MSQRESKLIDAMRAIAVLSIVSAHCSFDKLNIWSLFSSGGVALFFLISGYLFSKNKLGFKNFFKKNTVRLIVPWVLTGTLVYLYVYLRKGGVSLQSLLYWLIGIESYLWYMPVLLTLYLIFWVVKKYPILFWIVPILSIISFAINPLAAPFLEKYRLLYMNVPNWMLFFWMGTAISRFGGLEKWVDALGKWKTACVPVLAVSYLFAGILNFHIAYVSVLYPLCAAGFILFGVSLANAIYKIDMVNSVGKLSFGVYLLHMPFAGIMSFVVNKLDGFSHILSIVLSVLAPIIVLTVVSALLLLYIKVFRNTRHQKNWFAIIGLPGRFLNENKS